MMLGAGQILTPVKDTITLGDDHTQLPRWAVAGTLPHLDPSRHDLTQASPRRSDYYILLGEPAAIKTMPMPKPIGALILVG